MVRRSAVLIMVIIFNQLSNCQFFQGGLCSIELVVGWYIYTPVCFRDCRFLSFWAWRFRI